jgi:hypothetical protein
MQNGFCWIYNVGEEETHPSSLYFSAFRLQLDSTALLTRIKNLFAPPREDVRSEAKSYYGLKAGGPELDSRTITACNTHTHTHTHTHTRARHKL